MNKTQTSKSREQDDAIGPGKGPFTDGEISKNFAERKYKVKSREQESQHRSDELKDEIEYREKHNRHLYSNLRTITGIELEAELKGLTEEKARWIKKIEDMKEDLKKQGEGTLDSDIARFGIFLFDKLLGDAE